MRAGKVLCVLSALLILTCSCRPREADARRALREDVAARQHAARESTVLYEQGLKEEARGRTESAREHFRRAVRAAEDNELAWMALGAAEFRLENYYAAAEAFHRAAGLAPTRYEPHYNLGTVLETVGHYTEAVKAYEAALSLAPDQLEVIENLARTLVRAERDPDRAEALIRRALSMEFRAEWREWLLIQAARLEQRLRPAPVTQPAVRPWTQPAMEPRPITTSPAQE
jgi:Flp pilus assembly protein TadD